MDLGLKDKWALVTGASQGIGAGVAETFAEEGVNLHLNARNVERLAALQRALVRFRVEVRLHPMDITKPGACETLAEAAGTVDILVNNAGVIPSGTLFDVTEPKWREGWELKVFGYINLCRLIYPKMKARGGGVIINNIGNGGEVFDPQYIAGTSGNASLMAFTRALGGHSLDDNIRVMGVNPGPVNTDRIYNMLKKRAHAIRRRGPLQGAGGALSPQASRQCSRGDRSHRLPGLGPLGLHYRHHLHCRRGHRLPALDHLRRLAPCIAAYAFLGGRKGRFGCGLEAPRGDRAATRSGDILQLESADLGPELCLNTQARVDGSCLTRLWTRGLPAFRTWGTVGYRVRRPQPKVAPAG